MASKTNKTGHRFLFVKVEPYLRAGLKPPVTCAFCGKHAGDPAHNK